MTRQATSLRRDAPGPRPDVRKLADPSRSRAVGDGPYRARINGGEERLGLELSAHARRRMTLRGVSTAQVSATIVLCPAPVDQGDGTYLYRAFVDNRNLGVVRARDGIIVTVLDFDRVD